MIAGHVVIAVLLGFAALGLAAGGAMLGVTAAGLLGGVFIDLLEVLVAVLQAYIFTYLTILFIGMAVQTDH
jgi:F-type H+-transporting ATPase subunit a